MNRHDHALAQRLYAPPASTLLRDLTNLGEGLAEQLIALQSRPTAAACNQVATNLQGAARVVMRIRERLIAEGETTCGTD